MKILSVGSAFPKNHYDQQELTQELEDYWEKNFFNPERLRLLHKNIQVGSRRFCITLQQLKNLSGFRERNELFRQHAQKLGEEALDNAIKKAGIERSQIDHIYFTTITGIATPSIDALLVNRMGLRNDIKRTPIFGLGCLGGAAGLARAADYVKAWPESYVALLSVELCSLTIQKGDLSIPNIVASGLFGDGAAAVIIGGRNVNESGPQIIKSLASFYKDTERIMGWDIIDEGFKIVLSPEVPRMVEEHAAADLFALLDGTGVKANEIGHYICHPGGPRVLEALEKTLHLSSDALKLSWKTLREIGNLSSTSVLLVLQEVLEDVRPSKGEFGILMAMGPGFNSEWLLLGW